MKKEVVTRKSIIERLLVDDPCSFEYAKISEEESRLIDLLCDIEKEIDLKFKGDDEALELIDRLERTLDDLCFEESLGRFVMGVKFGVKFGMEIAED